MLLALTGYETALLVVALSFIAFALIVALVIPRSRPSFPGKRLGLFLVVCALFFAAQMTAVLVLAEVGEADEPVAEESTSGETETTTTETTDDRNDGHRDDRDRDRDDNRDDTDRGGRRSRRRQGSVPRRCRLHGLSHARRRGFDR